MQLSREQFTADIRGALCRLTGAWILAAFVVLGTACGTLLLHRTGLGDLLHQHIPDRPKRRLLLASVSFFCTFAVLRALTWSIHNHIGPFHDIHMAGRHIHHLVWGILLLLLVGYGWLIEVGSGSASSSLFMSRLMSLLYGAGAALALDEFALWLSLRDVYWAGEGRASLDAVVLFGTSLLIGIWGARLCGEGSCVCSAGNEPLSRLPGTLQEGITVSTYNFQPQFGGGYLDISLKNRNLLAW
ncbi:MAG TPA: hypothetical protein VEV41_27840 [Terriglobales bacterium]|nr:hypothetical protein [Terriglobales bacterium]